MCPMEQSGNIRFAEEFDDKPKCSIAHHVDRVSASLQPFFPNSRAQDGKQDQVKHDLRFTRWEAYPRLSPESEARGSSLTKCS